MGLGSRETRESSRLEEGAPKTRSPGFWNIGGRKRGQRNPWFYPRFDRLGSRNPGIKYHPCQTTYLGIIRMSQKTWGLAWPLSGLQKTPEIAAGPRCPFGKHVAGFGTLSEKAPPTILYINIACCLVPATTNRGQQIQVRQWRWTSQAPDPKKTGLLPADPARKPRGRTLANAEGCVWLGPSRASMACIAAHFVQRHWAKRVSLPKQV